MSGQRGRDRGRALAAAIDMSMDVTNSSHIAASAVAVDEASAEASMRHAATDWAARDRAEDTFIPREELGRRRRRWAVSIKQHVSTTAAGAVGRAPVATRVAPPAMPMTARRQQRMMKEDSTAEVDVCMCNMNPH